MSKHTPIPSNKPTSNAIPRPVPAIGTPTPVEMRKHDDTGKLVISGGMANAQHRMVRAGTLAMTDETRTQFITEMIRTLKPESRGKVFSEFNPTAQLSSRMLASVDHVYVVKVVMEGTEEAALVHLTHEQKHTTEQFQQHVDEALKVTAETHITQFRKQLEGKQLQAKPEDINVDALPRAIVFFEATMVDRFGYKKMILNGAQGTIQPTIVVQTGDTHEQAESSEPSQANNQGDGSTGN